MSEHKVQFRLKVGDVVCFGPYNFPYEYLGDGLLGGTTPPGDCGCEAVNAQQSEPRLMQACSRCAGSPAAPASSPAQDPQPQ